MQLVAILGEGRGRDGEEWGGKTGMEEDGDIIKTIIVGDFISRSKCEENIWLQGSARIRGGA
jgi:hypothetical protein